MAASTVFGLLRRISGQRHVGVNLAEKKPGACLIVDQHGVFADPAKPRVFGQRALQHGGAVYEGAVLTASQLGFNPFGQLGEAPAHELVIIPPECVPRDIGFVG